MSVRLNRKKNTEPFWLEQGPIMRLFGIKIKVRPQDSTVQTKVQQAAGKELRDLVESIKKIKENGGDVSGLPDLDDDVERAAYVEYLATKHAALIGIVEWEGVEADESTDENPIAAPVNPETVNDFVALPNIGKEFRTLYDASVLKVIHSGNAFSPAPNGTSEAGTTTAAPAALTTSPAPEGNAESTENSVHTS